LWGGGHFTLSPPVGRARHPGFCLGLGRRCDVCRRPRPSLCRFLSYRIVSYRIVSYRIVVSARNRFYDHHAIDWILRWRSRRFRISALAALCSRCGRGVAVAVKIASRADGPAVTRRATRATNASGIWIDQSANFIAFILALWSVSATSAKDVACCVVTSNGLAEIRDRRRRRRRRRI